jgi:hypothetical protein
MYVPCVVLPPPVLVRPPTVAVRFDVTEAVEARVVLVARETAQPGARVAALGSTVTEEQGRGSQSDDMWKEPR